MHTRNREAGSSTALFSTLTLGLVSASLYLLLYFNTENLEKVANLIRQGDKGYVVIPIGTALIFSFVHGAFTGKFWDLLGLKAKK